MRTQTISPRPGQNIFDVALEYYGDAKAVSVLWDDNPELFAADGMDVVLAVGDSIIVRPEPNDAPVDDLQMLKYYRAQKIKVNTGDE